MNTGTLQRAINANNMSEDFFKKDDRDRERLGKIVEMAKRGVGGEKTTALKMVRNLCKKYKLDFDEVMSGIKVSEYRIAIKTEEEKELLIQVIARYAHLTMDDEIHGNAYYKYLSFKTTPEKYIETAHAWDVLRPLYFKEKKRIMRAALYAFLGKHNLYYQRTPEEWKKSKRRKPKPEKEDKDEEAAREMGAKIARDLTDADLTKRLGTGK